MKKTSKSRMKKLPILLGTLLIISVAAYGTRAYFSDSASQQADIKLELGNIDIKSVDSDWFYTPEGGIANSVLMGKTTGVVSGMKITKQEALNITNVQPGDQFTRTFTFKNEGSLVQNVTVNEIVISDSDGIFKVDFETLKKDGTLENQNTVEVPVGGIVEYKMIISVDTDNKFNNDYNRADGTGITDTHIFDAIGDNDKTKEIIENTVTVKAEQTNK